MKAFKAEGGFNLVEVIVVSGPVFHSGLPYVGVVLDDRTSPQSVATGLSQKLVCVR